MIIALLNNVMTAFGVLFTIAPCIVRVWLRLRGHRITALHAGRRVQGPNEGEAMVPTILGSGPTAIVTASSILVDGARGSARFF
jgi:hypothetical protein